MTDFFETTPDGRAFRLESFGCRLNSAETGMIRENYVKAHEENTTPPTIILNSCAVTKEAERQLHQRIRRLKRDYPEAHIVVTGCMAELQPDSFEAYSVTVVSNGDKLSPEAFSSENLKTTRPSDIFEKNPPVLPVMPKVRGRSRLFLPVQNGCDHRCNFCIIPFARGKSRSASAGEVVKACQKAVGEGYHEIILTGVDITAWGQDLPEKPALGLLVRQILRHVPKLQRLRLSSLDCCEFDELLLSLYKNEEILMPHLHFSLQSGDDMILKRMRRRHSREQSLDLCRQVKEARPDMVLGADLIAGFPTESDSMFENSLSLIRLAELDKLHIFPFSARPGTPAAKMPQLPASLVKERAKSLREEAGKQFEKCLGRYQGTIQPVLFESEASGYTPHFLAVKAEGRAGGPSPAIENMRITGHDGHHLTSESGRL